MSGPTINIKYNERRGKYFLSWGNETFYNEDDELMEFDTPEAARVWLRDERTELYHMLIPYQFSLEN